jgi:hypothetical protein
MQSLLFCISFMAKDAEYFFMHLFAFLISYFDKSVHLPIY